MKSHNELKYFIYIQYAELLLSHEYRLESIFGSRRRISK